MRCEKCGKENLQEAKFCNNCGNSLSSSEHKTENKNIINQSNLEVKSSEKKSKSNKVNIVVFVVFAIVLFGGIKVYDYLSIPKSFTGADLNSSIISYASNLKNGINDDDLKKQIRNSDETEVKDEINTMIENAITAGQYSLINYLASTYVEIFDNDKSYSLITDYSQKFDDYSSQIEKLKELYGDIEDVYYNQSKYLEHRFYVTQVIGYVDDLTGIINEISDAMKNENSRYYVAYSTVNNESTGEVVGEIPYLIVSESNLSQAGVYEMNVIEFGTNTLKLENGFEKEVSVYKEVSEDYFTNLEKDYSNYETMQQELERNANEILKLINPERYANLNAEQNVSEDNNVESGNMTDSTVGTDNGSVDANVNESDNDLEDTNEEVLDDETKENIDDYLDAAWYVTDYGNPEFDEDGNAISPGIRMLIENDGTDYWIDVLGVFGSGACPSFYVTLEKEDSAWSGHYDDDGWGNSGIIVLYLEDGVPYITISALGGDIDNGLNVIYKPCTRIE